MFGQKSFLVWIVLAAVFLPCLRLVHSQSFPLLVQQLKSKIAEYVAQSEKYTDDILSKPSIGCLEMHLPQLDALTAKFEAEHDNCLKEAETAREAADIKAETQRANMENAIVDVCLKFDECDTNKRIADYMKCTEANADQASGIFRQVMAAAGKAKESVGYEYTTVAYTEKKCVDDVSSAYKKQTDDVIAELEKCLEWK